jgi:small subunit ribosomal protein S3
VGQKVNPRGFRLGITAEWDAVWFAEGPAYSKYLVEDVQIRRYLKEHLYKAGISRLKISRRANQVEINIFTARPGLIIGNEGKEINSIRDAMAKRLGKPVQINVNEETQPDTSSQLVAESVAAQLEKRVSHKRAMKQSMARVLRAHAKGVKIMCAGRLGGSEIARTEWYRMGRVPLHTPRAIIDFAEAEAMTIYGKIGIKVWIYKGDKIKEVAHAPRT